MRSPYPGAQSSGLRRSPQRMNEALPRPACGTASCRRVVGIRGARAEVLGAMLTAPRLIVLVGEFLHEREKSSPERGCWQLPECVHEGDAFGSCKERGQRV